MVTVRPFFWKERTKESVEIETHAPLPNAHTPYRVARAGRSLATVDSGAVSSASVPGSVGQRAKRCQGCMSSRPVHDFDTGALVGLVARQERP